MPNGVLIIAETRDGSIRSVTGEAVSEGRRLADEAGGACSALLIGGGVADQAADLGVWGAEKVYTADHEALKAYAGSAWLKAVEQAVEAADPAFILIAATSLGRDLAPRAAAALDAGYAAVCTDLRLEEGRLAATRPVYAGKAVQHVRVETPVAVASLRPKNFPVDESRSTEPEVEELDVSWAGSGTFEEAGAVAAAEGEKVDLTEADRIVSGGRGMGGPDNWEVLEELAEVLDAELGASRAVVDAGWRPHSEQVGQTGKTVTPQLYVACAISGAMQHLAGMSRSKTIVAVNKDPEAPIFGAADYGIVGDVNDVLPRLAEEIGKVKSD
ncbi:MAG: electron transfer flavoprotein subunit alpha/FixB family protein [bacterium]